MKIGSVVRFYITFTLIIPNRQRGIMAMRLCVLSAQEKVFSYHGGIVNETLVLRCGI